MKLELGLCSHFWLAGLDEIVENTCFLRQEYQEYWKDENFATVGPVRNHENFIVFTTTENADWLVLDLEPPMGGKIGQVVMQCTQPCELIVLADGLASFLRLICEGYKTQRFKLHSTDHFILYTED